MTEARIALSEQELKDVYRVRREVFIDEQGVPEEVEVDDLEDQSVHFIAYEDTTPVGAGRFRMAEKDAKAERVCVLRSHRKKGIGALLMSEMEKTAKEKGLMKVKLNAQVHAEAFYLGIGYKTVSDTFYDAGILHVSMEKDVWE